MGGSEGAGGTTGGQQNSFREQRRGALALGAGDVNDAQTALRITNPRQQPAQSLLRKSVASVARRGCGLQQRLEKVTSLASGPDDIVASETRACP
jgi:hypothetical protein